MSQQCLRLATVGSREDRALPWRACSARNIRWIHTRGARVRTTNSARAYRQCAPRRPHANDSRAAFLERRSAHRALLVGLGGDSYDSRAAFLERRSAHRALLVGLGGDSYDSRAAFLERRSAHRALLVGLGGDSYDSRAAFLERRSAHRALLVGRRRQLRQQRRLLGAPLCAPRSVSGTAATATTAAPPSWSAALRTALCYYDSRAAFLERRSAHRALLVGLGGDSYDSRAAFLERRSAHRALLVGLGGDSYDSRAAFLERRSAHRALLVGLGGDSYDSRAAFLERRSAHRALLVGRRRQLRQPRRLLGAPLCAPRSWDGGDSYDSRAAFLERRSAHRALLVGLGGDSYDSRAAFLERRSAHRALLVGRRRQLRQPRRLLGAPLCAPRSVSGTAATATTAAPPSWSAALRTALCYYDSRAAFLERRSAHRALLVGRRRQLRQPRRLLGAPLCAPRSVSGTAATATTAAPPSWSAALRTALCYYDSRAAFLERRSAHRALLVGRRRQLRQPRRLLGAPLCAPRSVSGTAATATTAAPPSWSAALRTALCYYDSRAAFLERRSAHRALLVGLGGDSYDSRAAFLERRSAHRALLVGRRRQLRQPRRLLGAPLCAPRSVSGTAATATTAAPPSWSAALRTALCYYDSRAAFLERRSAHRALLVGLGGDSYDSRAAFLERRSAHRALLVGRRRQLRQPRRLLGAPLCAPRSVSGTAATATTAAPPSWSAALRTALCYYDSRAAFLERRSAHRALLVGRRRQLRQPRRLLGAPLCAPRSVSGTAATATTAAPPSWSAALRTALCYYDSRAAFLERRSTHRALLVGRRRQLRQPRRLLGAPLCAPRSVSGTAATATTAAPPSWSAALRTALC
ncbi:hypothetical protein ACJJTC_008503 [Scirpophaga incertulas]